LFSVTAMDIFIQAAVILLALGIVVTSISNFVLGLSCYTYINQRYTKQPPSQSYLKVGIAFSVLGSKLTAKFG